MKQNFIELISVPFNAGESKLFAISGQYFELIDATNPIDVLLSDVNGAQRGVMRSAEASFNLKDTDFATVQLYSATAQTIRFAYGTGEAGTRRAAGAVSIVGDVGLNPATLAALESTDLNPASINALNRPELPTGNWKDSSTLAASTPLTLFTPAANVNGAILWNANANEELATKMQMVFIAKNAPPASVTDGEIIAQSETCAANASAVWSKLDMQQPRRIAAGLGLYFIQNGSGAVGSLRSARFTLL